MSIYQLRVVLRDISPLIWRRVLLHSESSLADLHAVLQIAFDWTDQYIHRFHIHGKDYGRDHDGGIHFADDPKAVPMTQFRFRPGERFRYLYNFTARWEADIRLEAVLESDPKRSYPVCTGGQRAAPPEGGAGAWTYMKKLHQHVPPLEEIQRMAEVVRVILEAGPKISVQEAVGDLEEFQDSLERLEAYQEFQPDHFSRRQVNARLRAWAQGEGGQGEGASANGGGDRRGSPGRNS